MSLRRYVENVVVQPRARITCDMPSSVLMMRACPQTIYFFVGTLGMVAGGMMEA
jgi:hypothetical protein